MATRAEDDAVAVKEPPPQAPAVGTAEPSAELATALRDLLETRAGERHVVAIQDFPDPDAISSGLAYREIARAFGIEVDIVYGGFISHPENLALVSLLDIDLTRYTDGMRLDDYSAAIFVDNQGTTTRLTGRLRESGVPTLAVIDHHAEQPGLEPVFRDVRPVGAAATQFAEYLASGVLLRLDPGDQRHVRLATALLHGLHSETASFIHAKKPEYGAAAFLSGFADHQLLERVLCVQKSRGTMDTIKSALGSRTIRGGLSVAGVGYLEWGDRDAIPQAADFLLAEEGVRTAVVFGIIDFNDGRESIIGSLRTSDTSLGVDSLLKKAFGRDETGRYYGGGRARAGGFEIDVGFLAGSDPDPTEADAKWLLFDQRVRRRLFEAAAVDFPSRSADAE